LADVHPELDVVPDPDLDLVRAAGEAEADESLGQGL
jgi:hypothetical protein